MFGMVRDADFCFHDRLPSRSGNSQSRGATFLRWLRLNSHLSESRGVRSGVRFG